MRFKPHVLELVLNLLRKKKKKRCFFQCGMGPSGRTENCCHCCAQRGSCASPAQLSALPWRTLLQLNIWFSKCLCNTPFFFLFFSPPNASRALLADLHLEVKCLAPVGHAASEPFDPRPDRREHSEALLLPGLRSELHALEAGPTVAESSAGCRQRRSSCLLQI